MGQGKNQMVVAYRQKFLHTFIEPLQLLFLLACRAVPVAAGIVRFPMVCALVTPLVVAAKACGTAGREQLYQASLLGGYLIAANIACPVFAHYASYGYLWLHISSNPSRLSSGLITWLLFSCCT